MENEDKFTEFPNFDVTRFDPGKNLKQADRLHEARRGSRHRPIMESEIREIQEQARSASEAARMLGVSYNTYKKYAQQYGIFDDLKNQAGIGIRKGNVTNSNYAPIEDILGGKHPNYPIWKLKKRLLLGGYVEEKCVVCGFEERRLTDHRVPLIIDFLDGDKHNHSYENIRMLCYNCHFLLVGNLNGPKKEWTY